MIQSTQCWSSTRMLVLTSFIAAAVMSPVSAAPPPQGIPKESKRFEGLENEAIDAWANEDRLYLDLLRFPATNKQEIKISRLANVVKTIHWLNDQNNKVQLQPEPTHWLIKLSETSRPPQNVLVMELDQPAMVFEKSTVLVSDDEGILTLPARFAVTHGSLLRYEPQAHKNTVGYWANSEDTAEWYFEVPQPGSYEVDILQGCGKGQGGSKVQIQLDGQSLDFEVQETGHFQNFIWRTPGTVTLPQSKKSVLKLVPQHKAAGAVMDVRAIRLVPVGTKRSFDSELADPAALP